MSFAARLFATAGASVGFALFFAVFQAVIGARLPPIDQVGAHSAERSAKYGDTSEWWKKGDEGLRQGRRWMRFLAVAFAGLGLILAVAGLLVALLS